MKKHSDTRVSLARDDLYLLLVCAVRYALGRRSYIVSWAIEQLREHARTLRPHELDVIIEDIAAHVKTCRSDDAMDSHAWQNIVQDLQSLRGTHHG